MLSKFSVGRGLIAAVAVAAAVVPVWGDAFTFARAHMRNPLWLPHAKLHTAMSFHASMVLGTGSLAVLAARWRRPKREDLAIAAFLATGFWAGLLLARLWPGTSYSVAGDPAFTDMKEPEILGVPANPNAVTAVVCVILGWLGFALAASELDPDRPSAD